MRNPDMEKLDALTRKYPEILGWEDDSGETRYLALTIGAGWVSIIDKLCADLTALCAAKGYPLPRAVQVKEKFGGLRFYVAEAAHKDVFELIHKAESDSYKTCENCGEPGQSRGGGWIQTLCAECDKPKKED